MEHQNLTSSDNSPVSSFCPLYHKLAKWDDPIEDLNDPSILLGFPGGSHDKESATSAGDLGWIPELGRSPGEGNGYPLQYSCLENSMGRGVWQATVRGVAKGETRPSD